MPSSWDPSGFSSTPPSYQRGTAWWLLCPFPQKCRWTTITQIKTEYLIDKNKARCGIWAFEKSNSRSMFLVVPKAYICLWWYQFRYKIAEPCLVVLKGRSLDQQQKFHPELVKNANVQVPLQSPDLLNQKLWWQAQQCVLYKALQGLWCTTWLWDPLAQMIALARGFSSRKPLQ